MQPSFDQTITQWIDFLDQYTLQQLLQEPEPDAWSLGQVYIHLLDNIRWQLDQAKASLSSDANKEKDMYEDAKAMFARGGFLNIQIKGPFTGVFIRQPESVEELKTAFLGFREESQALLGAAASGASVSTSGASASADGGAPARGKAKHPGLGYFNAGEWIQFSEMHMRHHFHQKRRIDQALGYRAL